MRVTGGGLLRGLDAPGGRPQQPEGRSQKHKACRTESRQAEISRLYLVRWYPRDDSAHRGDRRIGLLLGQRRRRRHPGPSRTARPCQLWTLGRLAALKVPSAITKDVAAPASLVSNTGMAPLDGRYDHATADGARRSLRPEEATAVGQIVTMAIELPRAKLGSALKRKTRGPRRAVFLTLNL